MEKKQHFKTDIYLIINPYESDIFEKIKELINIIEDKNDKF
tara:strand:+ start:403 stop:525 length:123 start_codon:yes stop_codon:yes gene_type:complete